MLSMGHCGVAGLQMKFGHMDGMHCIIDVTSILVKIKSVALYNCRTAYILEPGRPQMTLWHICIACWIPRAANPHSYYVLLIAFPLQRWLHECAAVLLYMYIAFLVNCLI